MNKKKNGSPFFFGLLGGIVVAISFLIYLCLSESFNYKSVYIVNPQIKSERLKFEEINTLKNLENKGLLVTPDQYLGNLASYYNTFVAFLSILFFIFSIISFFSIKAASKKDIEKEIDFALKEMLRDSVEFRDTVLKSIYGEFDNNYVDKEEYSSSIAELNLKISNFEELLAKLGKGEKISIDFE